MGLGARRLCSRSISHSMNREIQLPPPTGALLPSRCTDSDRWADEAWELLGAFEPGWSVAFATCDENRLTQQFWSLTR